MISRQAVYIWLKVDFTGVVSTWCDFPTADFTIDLTPSMRFHLAPTPQKKQTKQKNLCIRPAFSWQSVHTRPCLQERRKSFAVSPRVSRAQETSPVPLEDCRCLPSPLSPSPLMARPPPPLPLPLSPSLPPLLYCMGQLSGNVWVKPASFFGSIDRSIDLRQGKGREEKERGESRSENRFIRKGYVYKCRAQVGRGGVHEGSCTVAVHHSDPYSPSPSHIHIHTFPVPLI